MKKKISFIILIFVILSITLIIIDRNVHKGGWNLIYDNAEELAAAEAVLVLGARVYGDGRLSDIFRDRVDTALEVYRSGRAGKILVSGDHGSRDYDEVNAAKDYLLENGVKDEDVFTDHAGFNTYDSIYRARDVFLAESIIISTQEFHLPRALYIAGKLGLKAQGIRADKRVYFFDKRNHLREFPARIKAFFNVAFKTKPKFLGESIPISGSGKASWDREAARRKIPVTDEFAARLVEAAIGLTEDQVVYDPAYFEIGYPGGDVPADRGVCTDVVIRAYRKLGIDLQKEVHEDMAENFSQYPDKWGLPAPDTNIDHRRVPNLMKFFDHHNADLEISAKSEDYLPGDIVAWDLGSDRTHIGIVSNLITDKDPLIVHNIGVGQRLDDILFKYEILGHYRYQGK